MRQLAPDYVKQLVPYEPGKPEEEVERELGITVVAKLASNENPLGPSPKALEAIREYLPRINRYPDSGGYYLKMALSERLGFPIEQITIGNGSNETLELIARAFLAPGDEAVVAHPAFLVFEAVVQAINATKVLVPLRDMTHDLDEMARRVTDKTKVVFVANPNNPTGTMVGREGVERFIGRVPEDVLIVLDEAYWEYVGRPDKPRSLDYVRERENIIVLRTFSKVHGLAGLRIGYGVAREEIIRDINRVREPFNVNSLAQVAALASLDDEEHIRRSVELNSQGKEYLYRELERLRVDYVPSEANFILVNGGDGRELFQKLLPKGVIVRPMNGYGLHEYVRVSVGLPGENEQFIKALKEVLQEM